MKRLQTKLGLNRVEDPRIIPGSGTVSQLMRHSTVFHHLNLLSMKKWRRNPSSSKQLSGRGLRPELSFSPENSPYPSSSSPGWRPGAVLDEDSCHFPSLSPSLLSKATWPLGSLGKTSGLRIWRLGWRFYPRTPGGANSWQSSPSVGITP